MKRLNVAISCLSALLFLTTVVSAQEEFGIKEYDDFHRLLHMLQHEALPKNDVATIRAKAKELIKLGDAIVKLGVPKGTNSDNVTSFNKALEKFALALDRYNRDAKSGDDSAVKTSYGAVHEWFEELAGMLPRK